MTYLLPSHFRSASLHEACMGLDLTDDEADDVTLTAVIARVSLRLDRWTDDHYEPTTGTVDIDGIGGSRLELPARYTAVTSVKTLDQFGTLSSALATTAYRLHSSLNAAGTLRRSADAILDWLELVAGGAGLTAPAGGSQWTWPYGIQTVQIVGTYGWTTAPGDIHRALAMMVWDHVKRKLSDLRVAESVQAAGSIVRYTQPDPANGIWSGIHEVDEIVADYSRRANVRVG